MDTGLHALVALAHVHQLPAEADQLAEQFGEPGEVIGLVGRSGSGKSTLSRLIQRLYIPETGRVLIDGMDLAMIDTVWLRRQIGVVPRAC